MDIVERLKRVKYTRERNDAPNGFSWDEPCDADDYGAEQRFVNPDGPEAADEIERLRKEIHEYDDMIRDAGWYLTDDGGNSYKNADEIISHFLLAKDKARAEQNAALKDGE